MYKYLSNKLDIKLCDSVAHNYKNKIEAKQAHILKIILNIEFFCASAWNIPINNIWVLRRRVWSDFNCRFGGTGFRIIASD